MEPDALPDRGHELDEATDRRVTAVLEVLAGASPRDVAHRLGVEPAVVHRWSRIFLDAGAARLANRPEPTLAKQRDRFLAVFAHELRTPLAVAQGWAAMLADGDLPGETVAGSAARLESALDDLAARVADVEFLTAASLGRLRVERRAVELAELLAPLEHEWSLPAELEHVTVHTDPRLCLRVLEDLWSAAELHPRPRARHVAVRRVGPWMELHVVREADPMDTRVLQALFDPFDAGHDDIDVTTGLYLARALAVALGGTVGLEQDDERAIFWLRVPLAEEAPRA